MPGISPMVLQQLVEKAQQGDPQAAAMLQQLGYDLMGNPVQQGGPPGGGGMPPGAGGPPGGGGMPPGQAPMPQQVPQMVNALRGGGGM